MNKLIQTTARITALLTSSALLAQTNISGPDSPDVTRYGTPSTATPGIGPRTQVFGSPIAGNTVEIQVVGARPFVDATFYVGTAHDDVDVPGLGRVLVDMRNALAYRTTTDAEGRASVAMAIPNNARSGEENFVQCFTTDSNLPSPVTELSTGVSFQIGEIRAPIGAVSHLSGTIAVSAGGTTATSNALSGVYVLEWSPETGGRVNGTVAIHTNTARITVNGRDVENLRVQPGVNTDELPWTRTDFLTVPADTADEFLVSYSMQGRDYGPYAVAGTLTATGGDVDLRLAPLPGNGDPLQGATIELDMRESFLDPSHFDALADTGLRDRITDPASITPGQVGQRFADASAQMRAILASVAGDIGFFDPTSPTYQQFVALEGEILLAMTDGFASTATGLQEMVAGNLITEAEGLSRLLASKLLAILGLDKAYKGFVEALEEVCGDLLKELGKHLDAGEYRKAGKVLKKILKKIMGKKFAKKLADKIGRKLAGKILAKIGARCIPLIGWGVFALEVLWALIEQAFD
ncbi:MAG: hypothetical protein KDC98_05170 [Planctomycetes bacterium]|nr:hypothetical protein [Planctomycetota bacterium]